MRNDAFGLFWEDSITDEEGKRIPPERTWESPDFLPHLEEAKAFNVPLFTDAELIAAAQKETLVFDIESYPNYFLIAFKSVDSGKIVYFEEDDFLPIHLEKLRWVLENFRIVSFNGNGYDVPMLKLALCGYPASELFNATQDIIVFDIQPYQVLKEYKCTENPKLNHIDVMEVPLGKSSLKIYGGRLHCRRMQDLPFAPGTELNADQKMIVRLYCVNDLDNTQLLFEDLDKPIKLREKLGNDYGHDLRSKSDAQIAETVIATEVEKLNRVKPSKPKIAPGTEYFYRVPEFIQFRTPLMQETLRTIRRAKFVVSDNGGIGLPDEIANLAIQIGESVYRMGIGGLHSSEKYAAHFTDENNFLVDRDVTSYYPAIILNLGLFPKHLGPAFLEVYKDLVDRRIAAKKAGDKGTADSLKITINGSFGKLGSKYSILYSPDLLIQVTITGQLSLLLLIEALELCGIPVVSANTDGVVIKCPRNKEDLLNQCVQWWETVTGFNTEDTPYAAIYSRDVNNYIAVKPDGETKGKGIFGETGLSKNPANAICIDAVIDFLVKGVPVEQTIANSQDVRKFLTVRTVKGGAVKDGDYLGKAVRWYYAKNAPGPIVYAASGNSVARSEGARPLMDLPRSFPQDVDFTWYIDEAYMLLGQLGLRRG